MENRQRPQRDEKRPGEKQPGEKQLGPKGLLVAALVFVVLAIAITAFPMLAITAGHPLRPNSQNPNDIGRYFLTSVGCLAVALFCLANAALTRWRDRRK